MLFSCDKNSNCDLPEQPEVTGDIISDAKVKIILPTIEMKSKPHVIRADSQNVFNLMVSFTGDNNYEPIDFNSYTLLGIYTYEGCQAIFIRDVRKNDSLKECTYRVQVQHCGTCEVLVESMNWVLVERIPNDYEVMFKIEYLE